MTSTVKNMFGRPMVIFLIILLSLSLVFNACQTEHHLKRQDLAGVGNYAEFGI